MRVAVDAISAAPGGGSSYLCHQLPELEALGHELFVFAGPDVADDLMTALPRATVIPITRRSVLARFTFQQTKMERAARDLGADVLYCPGSSSPLLGRLPLLLCFQNPHLFTSPAPRDARLSILRIVAWLSALRATELVHISGAMAREFSQTSALRRQVSIVLSGANEEARRATPEVLPSGRPYLLAVSNLYRYKRMDLVIRAYAGEPKLHDAFDLVIVGGEIDSGLTIELAGLASELGRTRSVHILGYMSTDRVAGYYAGASLYVSTSQREAFPLTPLEAVIAGLPVVLSPIPVFEELYGEWALFADAFTPLSVSRAMTKALDRGPVFGAGDVARQRFSWTRNAAEVSALLGQALKEGRSRRPSRHDVDVRKLGCLVRTIAGASSERV